MSNELKDAHQRPEGRLIERAMKAAKVSGRRLAERIGLSEGRVRQIVNGYRTEGGQIIPIVGPADTVARMAEEVGVSADELRAAGRNDAAEELSPLRSVGVAENGDLWIADNSEPLAEIREWLARVDAEDDDNIRPPTNALRLWDVEQLLEAAREAHISELRLRDYFIDILNKRPRVVDHAGGGDGDADSTGGSAPIGVDKDELSDLDDTLPAAAKEQGLQGSGEEDSI